MKIKVLNYFKMLVQKKKKMLVQEKSMVQRPALQWCKDFSIGNQKTKKTKIKGRYRVVFFFFLMDFQLTLGKYLRLETLHLKFL